jgi:poly(3-hydroxybutyrate) depolymerase
MYYQLYELNHAFLSPARALNDAMRLYYKNPLNPMSHTELGRQIAAAGDVFERLTRRYGKPQFGLTSVEIDGHKVAVAEEVVWERPFCRLLHFKRARPEGAPRQPNVVVVAPMSGHYATLLRGTVAALLPAHEVFITDWADARMVPLALGRFDLDDYIDYVVDIVRHFAGDCHMVAVCQPAVPVFAATALMEADGGIHPRSITLMGGPIDTRENPTEVNTYAAKHDIDWFRRNVIQPVPFPHPGMMRKVYPGFLQLTGFMTMNLDRHMSAHYDYFDHLVKGDGDSADKHREFYDEYLSVMDLTEEFYLQTVETVFLRHALPRGIMRHRNRRVDPSRIARTPIFTVEGEKDDISGIGQTQAAHALCSAIPGEMKVDYVQPHVGH